jgi:hypothetical protein
VKPKVAAYCIARISTCVSTMAPFGLREGDAAGLGQLGHLGDGFAFSPTVSAPTG